MHNRILRAADSFSIQAIGINGRRGVTLKEKLAKNPVYLGFLMAAGWLSVALGTLGIFLPVLPTTPFLLLAAACFMRSSPKFYHWLVQHPKLGGYVVHYLNGKGLPKRAKVITIVMIWTSIGFSTWLVIPVFWGKMCMLSIALGVSIYIVRQPTLALKNSA
jgi:uncharacterized membrane protein YbaN (DUF454 family)